MLRWDVFFSLLQYFKREEQERGWEGTPFMLYEVYDKCWWALAQLHLTINFLSGAFSCLFLHIHVVCCYCISTFHFTSLSPFLHKTRYLDCLQLFLSPSFLRHNPQFLYFFNCFRKFSHRVSASRRCLRPRREFIQWSINSKIWKYTWPNCFI